MPLLSGRSPPTSRRSRIPLFFASFVLITSLPVYLYVSRRSFRMWTMSTRPSAVLGVLTDIQYAEKPDKVLDESRGKVRKYGRCLQKVRAAARAFDEADVDMVAQLGDLVDGYSGEAKDIPRARRDLELVLERLAEAVGEPQKRELLYVVGNHCLDVGCAFLGKRLGLGKTFWYCKELGAEWRIVVLDTTDVSIMREVGSEGRRFAETYLREHQGDVNAKIWNGMVGMEQLKWLKNTLEVAEREKKKVVVLGHHPVMDDADGNLAEHLLWNADEVRRILENGNVKLYMNGHYHPGGYAERNGIHYVTLEAVIDSDDRGSYGFVKFYDDKIVIDGVGSLTSRVLTISS